MIINFNSFLLFEKSGRLSNSTEYFIERAKKVHGDKYDYSLVDYKNTNKKVKIICPKSDHDIFEQTPHSHLTGSGCPICGKNKSGLSRTSNTEDFIEKAKKIHGDKFDYSLVDYKNITKNVKIICPIHGIFEQSPYYHLTGSGCPICGKNKSHLSQTSNTEDFIEKAKKIHGDKFDYSLVDYVAAIKKVKIICSIHGTFEQSPNKHLRGKGCPKCAGKNRTIDELIFIFKNIHGDKYDYSLVDYKNMGIKIKIICPNPGHGIFEQSPSSHAAGAGCPICAGNIISNTNDFIERAKNVHDDKYDYSLVDYDKARSKVKIICPKPGHGIFEIRPINHLLGIGCPICQESKGEKKIRNILIDKNIKYKSQKKFDECKATKQLPFDFYLTDYNICIEYDGLQHFEPVSHFGGEDSFIIVQKYDAIKTKFCIDNKIPLIRIPYTVKDIEEYLMSRIKTIIDGEYDYEKDFS